MAPRSLVHRSSHETRLGAGSVSRARWSDERGVALIVALMSMLLMLGLGLALVLTTTTETMITGNYRGGSEAMYAADAGVERVMQDLLTVPDWNNILSGAETSAFIDGDPSGTRTLSDGSTLLRPHLRHADGRLNDHHRLAHVRRRLGRRRSL
jgi:hypothetical protein